MRKTNVAIVAILTCAVCLCRPCVARSADKVQAAADNAPAASHGFQRLWPLGTLDPSRQKQWPAHKPGEYKLERIAVEPRFVLFTAHGDGGNPSYMDCYEARELLEGKSFRPRFSNRGTRPRLTLMVDFGRTMPGTLEFEAEVPKGTVITVETGEAMTPTRSYRVEPEPDGTRQVFRPMIAHGGWGSLRFAWIHFDRPAGPIVVHRIRGLCQILGCNTVGGFSCSDEQLTRIWEMCAYSAHASMAQPLENDTKPSSRLQTLCMDRVDRFPWAGDSRIIQTAVLDAFGYADLVRANLDTLIPRGARPVPDPTGIPPYTLDWAIAVMDYYRSTGDAAFLSSRLDDLTAIIDKFDPMIPNWETMPPPSSTPFWMFFDWDPRIARKADPQTTAAFVGKYVQTCRELADTAASLNRPEAAKHAQSIAEKHAAAWRKEHLAGWQKTYGLHAVTNLLLGGVLSTPEEQTLAFDTVYADRTKRWTNTPYFTTYILSAMAKIERRRETVELLHDYWGTMIEAGATSTWEEWSPSTPLPVNCQPPQLGPPETWGASSLLQPAGAGPVRWLLQEIAGIKPETPGYEQVRIEPHTAGLRWADGTTATPLGPIHAAWKDSPERFVLTVDCPAAVKGLRAVVPAGRTYRVNGQPAATQPAGSAAVVIELKPGHCEITVDR